MIAKNTFKTTNISQLNWMTKFGLSLNDFKDIRFKDGKLCLIGHYSDRINGIIKDLVWSTIEVNEEMVVYRNETIFVGLAK